MLGNLEIKVEPRKGATIQRVCDDAKTLSELIKREIVFQFNGVTVTTEGLSINEMVEKYCKHRT